MGMVIDGQWIDDDSAYRNAKGGSFVRAESVFRHQVTKDGAGGFKAEAGRYHLFLAPSCPWAHRTQIFRRLKGLEDVISVTLSDLPRRRSWGYSEGIGGGLDAIDGVFELHRAYIAADLSYTGRVTVPVLWDKRDWTIVNNESSEIIRMLNTAFDEWGDAGLDFHPAALRPEIDRLNARIYEFINNGVYRCGFARTQEAYETAFRGLFAALDEIDALLGERRYLCGARITEADWRLYPTLVRFDIAYYGNFKCNWRHIWDYPNLSNYLRELYQWPGIAEITDLAAIKRGYYSIGQVNPRGIVPLGPETLHLDAPHDRDRLPRAA
jgi:glutathionyl-hydroquinone reductase